MFTGEYDLCSNAVIGSHGAAPGREKWKDGKKLRRSIRYQTRKLLRPAKTQANSPQMKIAKSGMTCSQHHLIALRSKTMDERDYDYFDYQEIDAEIGRIESEGIWSDADFEEMGEAA